MEAIWIGGCIFALCVCMGCGILSLTGGAEPMKGEHKLLQYPAPIPDWWTGSEAQIQGYLDGRIERGAVRTLSVSPGGRRVRAVFYGEPEPELKGPANFNSAVAARVPDAYFRRGERKRPVLFLYGGPHGQEMEGMVACLSVLSIMETGRDLSGTPRPALREKLDRLRLIVLPLANPDGRARCPYDSWVGLPKREMTRWGQGTRKDGTHWGWPGAKAVHPMTGDVDILGAYFDDSGVNLMHDEWHAPMSRTTAAVLKLVGEEGPDLLLNLHSHGSPPAVLRTAYVPVTVKSEILAFAKAYYAALDEGGIAHGGPPTVHQDGPAGETPPSFNLTSAMYHAGAALPMTFESPHGVKDGPEPFDHPTILRLHHVLFETAADRLLTRPDGREATE